jgi:DNA-binding NarL/FixJ family response regulator
MARAALVEARELQSAREAPAAHPLSPRELEVLTLVAAGLTNKEIAFRLGLSDRTVQYHMNPVFNKTGTSSRTEVTSYALRQGWLKG